ncbi:MAG: hypothetical protein AB1611_17170 [bacterium]
MQGVAENSAIIEEMLGVERNAGKVLEEAKEKGNQIVLQARADARRLIEKTREDLQKERESLEQRLKMEGEEEVARIIAEKDEILLWIREHSRKNRERVLADLRSRLFEDLVRTDN